MHRLILCISMLLGLSSGARAADEILIGHYGSLTGSTPAVGVSTKKRVGAAVAPIAQRSKIVMLTPSSTNPKVTQVGNYIFRSCFTDQFQAQAMASYAMK